MIYTALAAAALAAGIGVWKVRRMSEIQEQDSENPTAVPWYKERLASINRLSLPEAREQVLELLTDTSRFTCVLATTPLDTTYDFLAPELHDFFTRFESVRTTGFESFLSSDGYEITMKEFVLDRALLRPVGPKPKEFVAWPSSDWTDWWHIGKAFRGSEYVLVKTGDEAIFEGDEYDGPDTMELIGRTIYHWIL